VHGPGGMGRWQYRERELGLDRLARDPAFPVIPVLLSGADPALGFLQISTCIDLRNGQTPEHIDILARAARGGPPEQEAQGESSQLRAGICPYRGLRAFREEDEAFFCGRESFTEKLFEALETRSFIAVVGASGSGKSSVVHAGLIPTLRHKGSGNKPGTTVWDIVTMRPFEALEGPLHSLASCFLPLLQRDASEVKRLADVETLAASFSSGVLQLRTAVQRVLDNQPGTDRLLLVVDQWEELYTICRDETARETFIKQLLDAATGAGCSVVITLRGDFFGDALSDRRLSDGLQGGVVNIGPMTRRELQEAVVKPAEKVSLRFEEGLDTRILQDVGDEPGNLALLEFLLAELWEKRRGGELLHESFAAIGGVRGAIAERAEHAFGRLSSPEQDAARWALVQLVAPGEGTLDSRRRASLEAFDATEREVIAKLTHERLLVTTRDEAGRDVVEMGHEALIREWQRLREWVNDDREFLRLLVRLEQQADGWEAESKPPDLLLQTRRALAEAEELINARPHAVGPLVRAYVEDSLAAERERIERAARVERERLIAVERLARRTKHAAVIVSALLAIATAAAGAAFYMKGQAEREGETAARMARAAVHNARLARRMEEQARLAAQLAQQNAQATQRSAGLVLEMATQLVTKVGDSVNTSQISSRLARQLLQVPESTLAKLEHMRTAPEFTKAQLHLLMSLTDAFVVLGATDQALSYARRGKVLAEQLENPLDRQRSLFMMGFRIGDSLEDQGYLEDALAEYRTALASAEFLAAQPNADSNERGYVSFMRNKVGDILKAQGYREAAVQQYNKSLALMQELVKETPGDFGQQRNLAAALNRVGNGLREQGNYEAALDSYAEAREHYARLLERAPEDASRKLNLSAAITNTGSIYKLLGDFDSAMKEYHESIKIHRDVAEHDRSNTSWQNYLSSSHINLAEVLGAQGKFDKAIEEFERALAIRRKLMAQDPKNALWQGNMASALSKLGYLYLAHGNTEQALARFREALAILEKISQTTEGKSHPEQMLFEAHTKIGTALIAARRPAEAVGEFKAALEICEPILKKDASDSTWQSNRVLAQKGIGDALKAQSDLPHAIEQYSRALDLSESILIKDTSNAERQFAVAETRLALAGAYYETGDRSEAGREYERAVKVLQKITAAHPRNLIWRRTLDEVAVNPAGFYADLARAVRGMLLEPATPDPARYASLRDMLTQGKRYALLIGNTNYQDAKYPRLATPHDDVLKVASTLAEQYGFSTELSVADGGKKDLVLLDATATQIYDILDDLAASLKPQDRLLIYYAGHGVKDPKGKTAYWVPVDARSRHTGELIPASRINDALNLIAARSVLVISDSCYSGALSRSAPDEAFPVPAEREQLLVKLADGTSRVLIASGGDEPVLDGGGSGHSIFARKLLQALGEPDYQAFSAMDLFARLRPAVGGTARQVPEYATLRESGHDRGDFVFLASTTVGKVAGPK
jgi:tetratricopeptide (TPR) repeat protein